MAIARAGIVSGAVGDQVGGFFPAFRVSEFLDQLQPFFRAMIGIQTCGTGICDKNPGGAHDIQHS